MAAKRRDDVAGIGPNHIAKLTVGRALPGMALTGRSGVPVVKASTSKLFQPNTRSADVSSGSPQS